MRACLAIALALAGCYGPSIPNGVQECAAGGVCAEGYQCAADDHCYRVGQLPGDGGARDLAGRDLAGAPDAAHDLAVRPDLEQPCTTDANCGGSTPRCDPVARACVPCLPQADNCGAGLYCAGATGTWQCASGCKGDPECGAPPDGGAQTRLCCNHVCSDTTADGANCGGCGASCNGKGCCASTCMDLTSDPANCGKCGNVCAGGNASWTCTASACAIASCTGTFADCDKSAANGCEADTSSDTQNCGVCGRACTLPANANAAACLAGACAVSGCAAPFADCNAQFADGCETNLSNDLANCGGCARPCQINNATQACNASACVLIGCNAGFANCNSDATDGCESPSASDWFNCGGCNQPCSGSTQCSGGACVGHMYLAAGSFVVNAGTIWTSNPPTLSCSDTCASLFGGVAASYACSTVNNPAAVDHKASVDGWGDSSHCSNPPLTGAVNESYKKAATYDCGVSSCSFSAYVSDHGCGNTNYCFR